MMLNVTIKYKIILFATFVFLTGCSNFSEYEEKTLKNGLRIILSHRVSPITTCVFLTGCGDAHGKIWLTQITNDLLLRGTEVKTGQQVFQEVESLGGRIGSETTLTFSLLYIQAPENTFDKCFDILCECLTRPTFDHDQIPRTIKRIEKNRLLKVAFWEKKNSLKDDELREMLFQDSPLGRILSDEEKEYSREEISRHYKSWYRPSNMVMAVVGNFNRNKVLEKVSSLWDSEKIDEKFKNIDIPLGVLSKSREKVVKENKSVDRVLIGFRAPQSLSESFFATRILEQLLASGESSLLSNWLVSNGKLGCEVKSYYKSEGLYGYFVIAIKTPVARGLDVKSFVLEKIDSIRKNGITQNAFEIAKRKLISEIAYQYQYTFRSAIFLCFASFIDSPFRTIQSFEEKINQTTFEEVQKVTKDLFVNPVIWISQGSQK